MDVFNLIALLLCVVALLSYVNDRFVRLPTAVGLMAISLSLSLGIVAAGNWGYHWQEYARKLVEQADFSETLMRGLLSFLLFAGAVQFRIKDLAAEKYVVGVLATVGVALSTFVIAALLYFASRWMGHGLTPAVCLLFGALISPTDPMAVVAILKDNKIPKAIESRIYGESLFNDGMAVVLFVVLMGWATGENQLLTPDAVATLLLRQIAGGAILGLVTGWTAYRLLVGVSQFSVEVLITLATACGAYAAAVEMHVSGPITVVVAALVIGNAARDQKLGALQLERFWELVDELLNAILFVWIGVAVLGLIPTRVQLWLGCIAIPASLLGRFLSLWLSVRLAGFQKRFNRMTYSWMTWTGLRGGVSVALALSVPRTLPGRSTMVSMTYTVVVFSVLVQGMLVGFMARRYAKKLAR